MSETRCMTPVLTRITIDVEFSPAEDMLDNSPPLERNILDIKQKFTTFLVSLLYYLLLFLFKHPIFQNSKRGILYRMRHQGSDHHYMLHRFHRCEDGKRHNNSEKTLLLCALAHQFREKSNTDLLQMLRQKLKPGQAAELVSKKTGPGQNKKLFESAAKLAKVGEIQVLVVNTGKIYKFYLENSSSKKVMQVQCQSDTAKHPSYSLRIHTFKCPVCECEFYTKDDKRAHVVMCSRDNLWMCCITY